MPAAAPGLTTQAITSPSGRLVIADEQAHLPAGGGQHLPRHPIDRNPR